MEKHASQLNDREAAYRLLRELGAAERLLMHAQLVGEAADLLMRAYGELGLEFDAVFIELGAALHDAGKITHPEELTGPGALHMAAGEKLLLANGVPPGIALCCVSHVAWQEGDVTLEEKTVALADRLWKGSRDGALELAVIDDIATRLGVGRWDIFTQLDFAFEAIAADGPERLQWSIGASDRHCDDRR